MAVRSADVAGVVAPPPLIFGVPLAAAIYENTSLPLPMLPRPFAVPIGGVLAVIAFVILIAAVVRFRKANTPLVPFEPTTAIVDSWPYSFSRNPVYLSMTLLYVAIALVFNTAWPLLLLPLVLLVMHRGVILREERYLDGKFGDQYRDYKLRVRRWL